MKLRVLDLFSGIGGFSLGLERAGGFETVAFCEIEEFPRKVLAKHWPKVPCYEDVRKLRGEDVGPVDVICGGYPCQPFSTAGKRRGAEDDRHLWPEFNRLVAELRPAWVIGENVAGHISMGLDDVLSDLEGQGYACRTFVIPACAVGAPHRRDRCWTIAHANGDRKDKRGGGREVHNIDGIGSKAQRGRDNFKSRTNGHASNDAHSVSDGLQGQRDGADSDIQNGTFAGREARGTSVEGNASDAIGNRQRTPGGTAGRMGRKESLPWFGNWEMSSKPFVRRGTHGIPNRMDRLKALGNAVVPQIPEMIGRAILAAEAET